jgi:hypothetical protein
MRHGCRCEAAEPAARRGGSQVRATQAYSSTTSRRPNENRRAEQEYRPPQ